MDSAGSSPSLRALQSDLRRSMGDYRRLSEQLVGHANVLLEQAGGGESVGEREPGSRNASSPTTVAINNACQLYVQYLTSLEEIVEHTEKLVRTSQHSLKLERGRTHLDNMARAVDAAVRCLQYTNALSELEATCERARKRGDRGDRGNRGNRSNRSNRSNRGDGEHDDGDDATTILALLRTLSQAAVPRVRNAARGCRTVLSASMQEALRDCAWPPPLLPSAATGPVSAAWQGFVDAGDAVFGELQEIIVHMLVLQMATEHATFSGLSDETARDVELWPAIEFADAVNVWVSAHFAPNMPTCKIERPEWLFSAVYHAVNSCVQHVDVFEACIEAQGIQQYFSMPVEVAKSVYRRGVLTVVKGVYVPLLFEEREPSYVLHFADEAVKFEDRFLPLRTDVVGGGGDGGDEQPGEFGGDGSSSVGTGSISRREGCMLLDLLFAEDSWRSQWLEFEEEEARQRIWNDYNGHADHADGVREGTGRWAAGTAAEREEFEFEFRPSAAARNAVETLTDLLVRTTYMSVADNRIAWRDSVVSTAIDTLKAHLRSEISRLQQFDHLADAVGAPTVSACLNDLRFVEHALLEPSGTLMDLVVSDELLGPFLDREAAALSTLRRKWTNVVIEEVAHEVVLGLLRDTSEAGGTDAADEASGQIARLLNEYATWMDLVAFRDLWVGMARAVDRAWAGEGSGDVAALERLVGAFSGCTSKPMAYFRLSLDPQTRKFR